MPPVPAPMTIAGTSNWPRTIGANIGAAAARATAAAPPTIAPATATDDEASPLADGTCVGPSGEPAPCASQVTASGFGDTTTVTVPGVLSTIQTPRSLRTSQRAPSAPGVSIRIVCVTPSAACVAPQHTPAAIV